MIPYNYEIISVDEASRVMEVVYTSEGRQTMHIGARLPYVGESLEAVINMFAPVNYWREQAAQVVVPALGSGQITPPGAASVTIDSAKAAKLDEIAAWRYGVETAGVTLGEATIRTDRESQAQITSAYTSLKNGLLASVNWKDANGQWVALTLAQIEPIAAAIAQHVQSCFNAEMALAEQVNAAQSIEAVNAVVPV
jgi:hypothetical protein